MGDKKAFPSFKVIFSCFSDLCQNMLCLLKRFHSFTINYFFLCRIACLFVYVHVYACVCIFMYIYVCIYAFVSVFGDMCVFERWVACMWCVCMCAQVCI